MYVLLQEVTDAGVTEKVLFDDTVYEQYSMAEAAAKSEWEDGNELLIAELKIEPSWEKPICSAQTFRGTHLEPPEYCENETALGSEFCHSHDSSDL